jgi:hypothetical protein
MQLNDFCQRFSTVENFRKSRLLLIPNKEDSMAVRSYFNSCPLMSKVRISDCLSRNDFLPSPQRLFHELRHKVSSINANRLFAWIEGFDAITTLWSLENISTAYVELRDMLDDVSLHFLVSSSRYGEIAKNAFLHPRYHEGKIVLHLGDHASSEENQQKIYLLDKSFFGISIPGMHIPNLQSFVRESEDHTLSGGNLNVFVDFHGHQLAGLSADLPQIYTRECFLQVFCGLQDSLSTAALDWLYEKFADAHELVNVMTLTQNYFARNGINRENVLKYAPLKMRVAKGAEREILLWMLRMSLKQRSYLKYVVDNQTLVPEHFTVFYVCEALNHLQDPFVEEFSAERKAALNEIGMELLSGELAEFIHRTRDFSLEQISPWLNCNTILEKNELVRRIMEMEAWEVPHEIFKSYPLLGSYMKPYQLGYVELNKYFNEYRQQKLKNHVTDVFCSSAKDVGWATSGIPSRDTLLQTYVNEPDTALLIVDALGAEYFPLLLALAEERSLGIETAQVACSKLPTSTEFNKIQWNPERRLPEVKALDSIIHNGAEYHMTKPVEENFVALLEVFESKILLEVAKAMATYSKVILTSDHGATRLAVCAYQQGLAETIPVPEGCAIDDWRYMASIPGKIPSQGLMENLSGSHWVVKGYNRLPKKGGKLHEMHGGATVEEILVPFIVFKQGAVFIPQAQQTQDSSVEFVEDDDFDL